MRTVRAGRWLFLRTGLSFALALLVPACEVATVTPMAFASPPWVRSMKVVAIGDSTTAGLGLPSPQRDSWPAILAGTSSESVLNKGVVGDTTAAMLARFDTDVLAYTPTHVVILGGVNDLKAGTSISQVQSAIIRMVERAKEGGIRPYVGTLTPLATVELGEKVRSRVRELNCWIRAYAASTPGVGLIDFYDALEFPRGSYGSTYLVDWVHPGPEGHVRMAAAARAALDGWDARPEQHLMLEDTELTTAASVLANEPLSADETAAVLVLSPPTHGWLEMAQDGTFTYRPDVDFTGTDSFSYQVTTARGASAPTAVSITVAPVPGNTSFSLSARGSVIEHGVAYTVSGKLLASGTPAAGIRVGLVQSGSTLGPWSSTSAAAITRADGSFKLTVRPRRRTYYRVYHVSLSSECPTSASGIRMALPKPLVSTPSVRRKAVTTSIVTVSGTVRRDRVLAPTVVHIYRYRRVDKEWVRYGHVVARVSNRAGYATYSYRMRLPYEGDWRLRAYVPATLEHAASWSRGLRTVTVKEPRQR